MLSTLTTSISNLIHAWSFTLTYLEKRDVRDTQELNQRKDQLTKKNIVFLKTMSLIVKLIWYQMDFLLFDAIFIRNVLLKKKYQNKTY